MRRTKIVATIGPASDDVQTLERMILAGMDVARLNFSHGTPEEKASTAQRVRVAAVRQAEHAVDTVVELGGTVSSRQGLNVPGELLELPSVGEEDLDLLRFGESIGVDMVALSFVRRPEDVDEVRRHTRSPLIAKIEKPQAVDNAEGIIRAS